MKKRILHVIGVDEAGRGPLAGPVAVGLVLTPHDFDWKILPGVGDSKQLSESARENLFVATRTLEKAGKLRYVVSMVSAPVIDRIGITRAVSLAIKRGVARLVVDPEITAVKLDGLLNAPEEFIHQETIIKGDQKEQIIGLASIMAKVTRDRYMVKMAKKYPQYIFEAHKGYGTKAHLFALKRHRLCVLHRRSYLKNTAFLHDV